MTDLATYIDLVQQKRDLDARSRELGAEIEAIEAELLDDWTEAGRSSETVNGYTVYLSHRDWATPKDGDRGRVVAALEALGMRDMVTYNTITLSSWWKEQTEQGEEVPATLAEVIDLTTKWSLNVRKGKGAKDNG